MAIKSLNTFFIFNVSMRSDEKLAGLRNLRGGWAWILWVCEGCSCPVLPELVSLAKFAGANWRGSA